MVSGHTVYDGITRFAMAGHPFTGDARQVLDQNPETSVLSERIPSWQVPCACVGGAEWHGGALKRNSGRQKGSLRRRGCPHAGTIILPRDGPQFCYEILTPRRTAQERRGPRR